MFFHFFSSPARPFVLATVTTGTERKKSFRNLKSAEITPKIGAHRAESTSSPPPVVRYIFCVPSIRELNYISYQNATGGQKMKVDTYAEATNKFRAQTLH